MDSAGSLCIFLLGRFEVKRGERLLHASAWTRRKAAALLQRLAFERRLLKEQAIEFLWPEHDPMTGANNLYRTLHALRQTLDMELGTGATEATFAFHDGVLTLADNVWVDVAAFESLAQSNDQADLIAALRLYTGTSCPMNATPSGRSFRVQRSPESSARCVCASPPRLARRRRITRRSPCSPRY